MILELDIDLEWYEWGGFISAGIAIVGYSAVLVITILTSAGVLK